MHVSSMANIAVSLSGVVDILNNRESSKIYFPTSTSIFLIAAFELGNLF